MIARGRWTCHRRLRSVTIARRVVSWGARRRITACRSLPRHRSAPRAPSASPAIVRRRAPPPPRSRVAEGVRAPRRGPCGRGGSPLRRCRRVAGGGARAPRRGPSGGGSPRPRPRRCRPCLPSGRAWTAAVAHRAVGGEAEGGRFGLPSRLSSVFDFSCEDLKLMCVPLARVSCRFGFEHERGRERSMNTSRRAPGELYLLNIFILPLLGAGISNQNRALLQVCIAFLKAEFLVVTLGLGRDFSST
jgi:hypothetical protein